MTSAADAAEAAEALAAQDAGESTTPDEGGRDLGLRTLREFMADPGALEPPEPLADRIAYRGYVTLLASREKLGKSTLASAVAARVSSGLRWLGSPVTAGRVLYASLDEAPRDSVRRLVAYCADPEMVTLLTRLPTPSDPSGDLRAAVEQVAPDLVVVDTLAEYVRDLGLDSGDAGAWTPVIGGLARIARDHDLAVLLLHHTRKDGQEYRDSTAIGASVDLILTMREAEGDSRARTISARGRLPVDGYTVRLLGDPHDVEGRPRWELASGELSLDARLILYVETHPGASTRQLREGVTGRGAEIDASLGRLMDRGVIVDRGAGSGRALHRNVRVALAGSTAPGAPGTCVP